MTTPDDRKTIKISAARHAKLIELAEGTRSTVDDVLGMLVGPDTLLVQLSEQQRARWMHAARQGGMSLEEFVKARVEAALQYDADPTALYVINKNITEVLRRLPDTRTQ